MCLETWRAPSISSYFQRLQRVQVLLRIQFLQRLRESLARVGLALAVLDQQERGAGRVQRIQRLQSIEGVQCLQNEAAHVKIV